MSKRTATPENLTVNVPVLGRLPPQLVPEQASGASCHLNGPSALLSILSCAAANQKRKIPSNTRRAEKQTSINQSINANPETIATIDRRTTRIACLRIPKCSSVQMSIHIHVNLKSASGFLRIRHTSHAAGVPKLSPTSSA